MKKQVQLLMTLLAMTCSFATMAQNEEGKIKIEITKEINGEKRTFKGEYNSTAEMKADPNYQEFAGDEDNVNFWFGPDDDMTLHLDQLRNHSKSFFKFFDDDDANGNSFFFHNFDGDTSSHVFDFQFGDSEELKERLKELGIEMDVMMNRFHNDDGSNNVSIMVWKKVKVTDVGDEFGKKGKVDDSNMLELEDLTFYPNPSPNGQFKVRFTAPSENELSIRVSNLEGKEVFSRYFESFSGVYSEKIDLSHQKEGIYLLEITQGKKRLTKKIVIN